MSLGCRNRQHDIWLPLYLGSEGKPGKLPAFILTPQRQNTCWDGTATLRQERHFCLCGRPLWKCMGLEATGFLHCPSYSANRDERVQGKHFPIHFSHPVICHDLRDRLHGICQSSRDNLSGEPLFRLFSNLGWQQSIETAPANVEKKTRGSLPL